ncbi:hypothetical protein [Aestuariispira insulae]|uniref:Uncharacterized protein n=1 Tax=Aestuariispira insulae TaxID=1461337 RepID=A0A3D9HK71_9PROT|nr:hypothetical protein [Aestuariispira insulae]RED49878.1 hypothetical protein DFP90_105250 [Aestuariispira insulae]
MLDTLSILISSALLIYVIVRAILLDRSRPWYPEADEIREREKAEAQTLDAEG